MLYKVCYKYEHDFVEDQSNLVVMLDKHLGTHPKTTQPLQLLEDRYGFFVMQESKIVYTGITRVI